MKILSWNILAHEFIEPKYYPMVKSTLLTERQQRIVNILNKLIEYNADIVLLQEVMKREYKLIKKIFSKKYFISKLYPIYWEEDTEEERKETNSNLKRKEADSNLSESGNLTLVKKKITSTIKFSKFSKEMPFVVARFIYKKKELLITNVHLDAVIQRNRLRQIKEIVKNISAYKYVIIGGDFNEEYSHSNKLYSYMKSKIFTPSITDKTTYFIEKSMIIDNIMYKNFKFIKSQVHNNCGKRTTANINCQFKRYGSDHFPIISYIEIS